MARNVNKDVRDGDHLREEAHEDDAMVGEVDSLDDPATKEGAPTSRRCSARNDTMAS